MKGAKIIGVGAVLGVAGVALGAFGAHGLKETLELHEAVETWDTASLYNMFAALAVIGCGLAAEHFRCKGATIAAIFLTLGALCFSGSLYGYALSQWKPLVFVTPVGGLLMMLGFASLAWTAFSCAGSSDGD